MTVDGRVVAGRYRLGRRIGSGAMGVVWQAHDELLYRTVAVKQLLLQPGQSEADAEEARRRAMREGRIAARLQHPNAVAVFDVVDEGDGMPWLVMEYVPSRSLSAVLEEQGTLPPQEAARIGMHVASALAAAHAAGIVHRDVKPGNVLLGDDGTVKITDFGISRAQGDSTVTATGMLAGTPAYLAPEIAKGHDPTPSSDVFSLGATLYATVEGIPPFGLSDNPLALLHKVASGQIEPPRQAGPLTQPLLSLLAAEPTERVTMVRCREALGAVASGRPAPAMPIPTAAPTMAVHAHHPSPMATRVEQRPLGGPPRATSTTAMPPVRPKGQTSSGGPNRGAVIGIAAAVVIAVIVGVILVTNRMNHTTADGSGGGGGGSQGGGNTSTTTSAPPATAINRPPVTSQPDLTAQQQAITDFYAQLPGNAQNAAQAFLTPDFQGGAEAFVSQMSGLKAVTLDNVQPGDFFFRADEHLVAKDGSKTVQPVGIGLKWANSQLYIQKVQNLGAAKPES
ncbi:serine/threonine-protein kinase [Kutzneria buriramensis]|uniref:non-specific serine/threonine protein kinase n=1 Tax=Kutzneria buriramensis TaxID=1045776 RepID=A0A3E0I5C1_9PSEU|nr:serine/threonine-protein kinase [Kutzneria buriramensis]REH53933.1 serine/threonine protein kinase [Kutzneria buriramensis]